MKFKKIGVVGIGNIGSGVVVDLVLHGIETIAVDRSDAAVASARAAILQGVRTAPLLAKGAPRLSPGETLARVAFTTRLEDVSACDFIIENVTEDWSVKRPLYERLDAIAPAGVCLAANTSCISITRIAGATRRPDRVIGLHFMNPVTSSGRSR